MGDEVSVLLVDDDEDELTLVGEYLARGWNGTDFRITAETDPVAALERVRGGERFDCLVSDTDFPGMDGIGFVEAAREHQPSLPVLLFATDGPADVAAHVVDVGITDYLHKGFGADQYTMLVRRVSHAVDGNGGSFDPERDVELDCVCVVGRDERFESVDEEYASLYGYTASEVEGRHWTDLHPEEAVEHIRAHVLPLVARGGQWTGRSEGLRADGSTFTESKLVRALEGGRLLIGVTEVEPE